MRNAQSFLSKKKHPLPTLQSIVKVKGMVNYFLNVIVGKKTPTLESVLTSLEAFLRNAQSFLSEEKHSLQPLQSIVRSKMNVELLSIFCSWKDKPFLLKVY